MSDQRTNDRLNVLLSAYACTPGAGSEPGVGFEALRAVAAHHNVWVLTRRKNVAPLKEYFAAHPAAGRVEVIGIDLSDRAMAWKRRLGQVGVLLYYEGWQRKARETGIQISATDEIDIAHHVTFASDWSRAGVAGLGTSFVWGPVGGGVRVPLRLVPVLGLSGTGAEVVRVVGRSASRLRRWYRRAWRSAGVVMVQNPETAALARGDAQLRIVPNSTSLLTEPPEELTERNKTILVVGRLIPWKGGALAIRAFQRVADTDSTLHFVGSGPDERRLRRLAEKLGLGSRIIFHGPVPRPRVLQEIAHAGVLLHPALHDESPVTVGEALSLGTPVVCLQHGGPRELLKRWPDSPSRAIPPSNPKQTAGHLAEAIDQFLNHPPEVRRVSQRPSPPFDESLIDAYRLAVKR